MWLSGGGIVSSSSDKCGEDKAVCKSAYKCVENDEPCFRCVRVQQHVTFEESFVILSVTFGQRCRMIVHDGGYTFKCGYV